MCFFNNIETHPLFATVGDYMVANYLSTAKMMKQSICHPNTYCKGTCFANKSNTINYIIGYKAYKKENTYSHEQKDSSYEPWYSSSNSSSYVNNSAFMQF